MYRVSGLGLSQCAMLLKYLQQMRRAPLRVITPIVRVPVRSGTADRSVFSNDRLVQSAQHSVVLERICGCLYVQ